MTALVSHEGDELKEGFTTGMHRDLDVYLPAMQKQLSILDALYEEYGLESDEIVWLTQIHLHSEQSLLLTELIGFSGEVVTLSPAVVTEPEVSVEDREVSVRAGLTKPDQ